MLRFTSLVKYSLYRAGKRPSEHLDTYDNLYGSDELYDKTCDNEHMLFLLIYIGVYANFELT